MISVQMVAVTQVQTGTNVPAKVSTGPSVSLPCHEVNAFAGIASGALGFPSMTVMI